MFARHFLNKCILEEARKKILEQMTSPVSASASARTLAGNTSAGGASNQQQPQQRLAPGMNSSSIQQGITVSIPQGSSTTASSNSTIDQHAATAATALNWMGMAAVATNGTTATPNQMAANMNAAYLASGHPASCWPSVSAHTDFPGF